MSDDGTKVVLGSGYHRRHSAQDGRNMAGDMASLVRGDAVVIQGHITDDGVIDLVIDPASSWCGGHKPKTC